VARKYGAKYAAHGCTAKGNDQVRIDVSARCLDPTITVLGPAREWNMTRPQLLDYLAERGIELPLTKKNPYSIDENLWGRAIECGELEDPWTAAPSEAFQFTTDADKAPDEAQEVIVGFEAGIPVSLDGKKMGPIELVETIDQIGGKHGFGRIDMVENRLVGIKSREVYEEAGSLSLIMAHRELEDLTLTRELQHFKTGIDQRLSELIYDGLWFSPLARALRAFIDESQRHVTGEVRLRYYKGSCQPVGRRSDFSLYDTHLATYGHGDTFSHQSAVGFIKLWGLPLEVWAQKNADTL
jgi:argininosuccinate synthase